MAYPVPAIPHTPNPPPLPHAHLVCFLSSYEPSLTVNHITASIQGHASFSSNTPVYRISSLTRSAPLHLPSLFLSSSLSNGSPRPSTLLSSHSHSINSLLIILDFHFTYTSRPSSLPLRAYAHSRSTTCRPTPTQPRNGTIQLLRLGLLLSYRRIQHFRGTDVFRRRHSRRPVPI